MMEVATGLGLGVRKRLTENFSDKNICFDWRKLDNFCACDKMFCCGKNALMYHLPV